jgi:Domain of unknown function (DUF4157)
VGKNVYGNMKGNAFLFGYRVYCSYLISFALAHQNKTNKAGDAKTSIPIKHISSSNMHHAHINPLNRDSPDYVFHLQRAIGNQAVQSLMRSNTTGFDFAKSGVLIQPKLKVSQPGDTYEEEADKVAEQVMRMPDSYNLPPLYKKEEGMNHEYPICEMRKKGEEKLRVNRKPSTSSNLEASGITNEIGDPHSSSGLSLDSSTREFMETRFGYDFGNVRIHTGDKATKSTQTFHALAYTVGNDIVFAEGKYAPSTLEGRKVLAHELTHVLQQTGERHTTPIGIPVSTNPEVSMQRMVEVRPPGRGEASAFDRRQELIDRLNTLSTAIQYRLDGRRIVYDVIDEGSLTHFERQMRGFIDRAAIVPLRLITSAGRVRGSVIDIDFFDLGYVDIEDLLASSDLSFQMNLLHLLVERLSVRNYGRRLGTFGPIEPEFDRAHRAGIDAEAEFLRDVIEDPTIRFNYEEARPNGTIVFAFRSNEGYRIFHVIRHGGAPVRGGDLFVITRDGRRLTIDELRAERAAVPAPAIP